MSGGPVVCDGRLLGVVTEHAPRAGSSAITATPLSALEANPTHPRWGPGVTNPRAWWTRLNVRSSNVLQRLPVKGRATEPTYWATVRDIQRRTGTLIGREQEIADLESFISGANGYKWLVGEAWAGKTSLLAETAISLQEQADVICYFLSRREADADSTGFLLAVLPQLASLVGEDTPPSDLNRFRALWENAVERARICGGIFCLL